MLYSSSFSKDGETEIEKDAKREAMHKKRAAKKGKAKMRVESDDEYGGSQAEEVDDEDEIVEIKKGDYLAKVGIAEPVRQPPMVRVSLSLLFHVPS